MILLKHILSKRQLALLNKSQQQINIIIFNNYIPFIQINFLYILLIWGVKLYHKEIFYMKPPVQVKYKLII
jgi:hypothetical protein